MTDNLPLFPLGAVLFPGGLIKLRVFEPRYLAMVSRCLREDAGFGVVLILAGVEAGGPVRTAQVGTLARIADFEQLSDGLLGITAQGGHRFRILSTTCRSDGLNTAVVEWLDETAALSIPPEMAVLAELVRQAGVSSGDAPGAPRYDDASWVGMRLAQLLPLTLPERQRCLEMNGALERLQFLRERLDIRHH
ncbi:hypothetical protein ACG33_03050 [Steroidobacter denitrificans]|uniref:Lon N-terminal domain-containing protein n=1 Tax=Steroidobacter denitrificans TaxID=465721 RepID=A0A127F6M4_STEDE|nr:LON peptidase substrate-binding domain-containing protein [Steroidobacter denitrificans]AMN46102.1 hypothetical protein ACG33_03050 [Steroidobacter denitrificans]